MNNKTQNIKKECLIRYSLTLHTQDIEYLSSLEDKNELGFELANLFDCFLNDKELEYVFYLLNN